MADCPIFHGDLDLLNSKPPARHIPKIDSPRFIRISMANRWQIAIDSPFDSWISIENLWQFPDQDLKEIGHSWVTKKHSGQNRQGVATVHWK